MNPDGTISDDIVCFCAPPGFIISGPFLNYYDAESYAAFAEVNWQFAEQFKLTLGVRYTDDTVEVTRVVLQGVTFALQPLDDYKNFKQYEENDPFVATYLNGKAGFDALTPRVVLTWTPSDELTTYANVSQGYKPGGFTFNEVTDATVPYKEESIWNYELGLKWRGFDNRFQINAAVFYMDWEDLQIPSVEIFISADNEIINNFVLDNIAAESKGFELEVQGLATEQLLLGGSVGYLKAVFKEFGADNPFVINNNGFDIDGVTIPRAPEWTISLFAQYDFDIGDKPAWIRAEYSYRASTTSDIEAAVSALPILDNAVTQEQGLDALFNGTGFANGLAFPWPRDDFPSQVPSYDVVNLRAGISGERWAVNVYVENVFDDHFYTGTQENFGLGGFRVRPHFRVAGIKVRFFSE